MAYQRNLFSLLLISLLSSCSILEYSEYENNNYESYNNQNTTDDEFCDKSTAFKTLSVLGFIADIVLDDDNDSDQECIVNETELDDDMITVSVDEDYVFTENTIILDEIFLKPKEEVFYTPYYNHIAEQLMMGRINIYITYDNNDEEYYLIQKGDHNEIVQVPKTKKKFRRFIHKLVKDNEPFLEQNNINTVNYVDLLDFIDQYNLFYLDNYLFDNPIN